MNSRLRKDNLKHYALLIVSILILPLSGCMMWTHGMDHGPSRQSPERAKTIEKEIPEKDARLTLDVPPLFAGEEATLVLTAGRIQNGAPLTGATVTFLIERLRQPEAGHADYDVVTSDEREAEEIADNGIYQARYKFGEQGLYRITALARIEADVQTPVKIAIVQDAGQREGHDNDASVTLWMIVGGIGMAAMMLLMVM
jgi:hypothetical protein